MDNFLHFFEVMPAWQKASWVFLWLLICWLVEGYYPLAHYDYKKWSHARVNLTLLAFTFIINFLFGILTVGIFQWGANHQVGILFYLNLPAWLELVITVMTFDFIAQYVVHYLLHKVKFMWRFHLIHHSDTFVDVTSGTRHHPGDYFMREIFALIAIIILGAPFAFYIIYRLLSVLFTYVTHANVKVPKWVDRTFGLIFVTPNIHKFHHHHERPWTDSNYGNIFSMWDRFFGTLVYDDPQKIKYGLDVLNDNTSQNLTYQLKLPFLSREKGTERS